MTKWQNYNKKNYIEHKQCLLFPMNFYELCLVLILHTLWHCVQDLYKQYVILHILFDFTHYVHYIHIDSMQFQFLRERKLLCGGDLRWEANLVQIHALLGLQF